LIEDNPFRTVDSVPGGAVVTGTRKFEGNLFTFRLGPYIDLPLNERFTLSFSLGPALGVLDGEYSFRQTIDAGGATLRQRGSGSNTDVLYGGYVSATIRYAFDKHWSVFLGGQYTGLTGYETSARGQKLELDLSVTASATAGVSYSF
jgi:hypothetical protein